MSKLKFELPSPPVYLRGVGIKYKNNINRIPKANTVLTPFYEAISNSLEALKQKKNGFIKIIINFESSLLSESEDNKSNKIDNIIILDNGIGFTDEQFNRFINLDDDSKTPLSKGIGRVQFLHFFNEIDFESVYFTNNQFYKRKFSLSKKHLEYNAFVHYQSNIGTSDKDTFTQIKFSGIEKELEKYLSETSLDEIKKNILVHFLSYFHDNQNSIPKIEISTKIGKKHETKIIEKKDFFKPDKILSYNVNYEKKDGHSYIKDSETEQFKLLCYKFKNNLINKNSFVAISNGQTVQDLNLEFIKQDEKIDESYYQFFISSKYIDRRISDNRTIVLISKKTSEKNDSERENLFPNEDKEIYLEEVKESAKKEIRSNFPEIEESYENFYKLYDEITTFFETDKEIKSSVRTSININFSQQQIIEKLYVKEVKKHAELSDKIKTIHDQIKNLDPNVPGFQDEIDKKIKEYNKNIPLHNKYDLAKYVTRRKITIEILKNLLKNKKKERSFHNLFLEESNQSSDTNSLWLLSEDFIYYESAYDKPLDKIEIKINGKEEKIFRDDLTENELKKLHELREKREIKKPDVFLYPSEGKVILIDFKNPKVNCAMYAQQLKQYAALIHSLSKRDFNFNKYYAYLIGEGISIADFGSVGGTRTVNHLYDFITITDKVYADYADDSTIPNGDIFLEVHKYSSIIKRAESRNLIFFEKLGLK